MMYEAKDMLPDEFNQTLSYLLLLSYKGFNMAKKLTLKEWVEKAKQVHGNTYDYSESEYTNSRLKIEIICPEHGRFWQKSADHLQGRGCPKCGKKVSEPKVSKLMADFISKAKELHEYKYSYEKVKYTNNKTKVTITCPEHGDFSQTPNSHLSGCGCPECGGTKKLLSQEFIQKSNEVHNNKYDYSKVVYVNVRTKVKIICPIHGEFEQTPDTHLQGKGCLQCGYDVVSESKTKSEDAYLKEVRKVHDDYYDYSLVNYFSAHDKITIVCPEHGSFTQTANSHLRGRGCPSCSKGGFDPHKGGILYYLKVTANTQETLYKIGITNKSVNERFSVKDLQKIEVLSFKCYEIGADAYEEEQRILKKYKKYKYNGPAILESGNTEIFSKNILPKGLANV